MVDINGDVRCLSEWCDKFGLKRSSVKARIRYGWTHLDALTKNTESIKIKK